MSKRGLPTGLQMRHDAHYVEELAQHRPQQVGRMIAVDKLDPNPEQPRTEFGDLTELTASIAEKGVLEPLLVKPNRLTGRWMIIAGERRWRSAPGTARSTPQRQRRQSCQGSRERPSRTAPCGSGAN